MSDSKFIELHAIIRGRVQGVGFRWTVVDYAERYHLTGTTKNLSDGTVEVYAQGPKEALQEFLHVLREDPGLAKIDSVKSEFRETNHSYQGFRIIF